MTHNPHNTVDEPVGQALPPKPSALPVIPENLPDDLKARPQWVVWRYEWNGKKWDKPPRHAATGAFASSTDASTWSPFAQALAAVQSGDYDGLGYVFSPNDPYTGIDLDHCIDDTNTIDADAWSLVQRLNSYTEYSPSGVGLHTISLATLPGLGHKKPWIEVYDRGRYFTCTGQHIRSTPLTINDAQATVTALSQEIWGTAPATRPPKVSAPDSHGQRFSPALTDDQLLTLARKASNGAKFSRLWSGDTSAFAFTNPDGSRNEGHSEADLALCGCLGFFSQDEEQIDRLIRQSGLTRDKWDHRGDYRNATIRQGIDVHTEYWTGTTPSSNGQPQVSDEEDPPYHSSESSAVGDESAGGTPLQQLGGVKAKADGYYRVRMIKEAWVETRISSFTVKPTLRIWVDGSEAVRAHIQTANNTLADVTIERHCWHSRGAFLKVLPALDQWCVATDNEIQAIQAIVAMQKVPSKRGTRTLGLVDGVWVSDEGIFNALGWIQDPGLVYLPISGESPLTGRLRYRVQNSSERVPTARAVYERVWKLNELTVIGALIGWFFSTPFKPYIQAQLNHFPILNVWGTMGAGKTSLLRLFWKLFGVDSELLACTDTEFSLLSLLSATSSIPLVFDEFKPYDMKPDQVRRFERILRRVYDGDTEHRGRPDLRLITYRLMAPVAVAGEVSVARQPAMRERIIPVSPSKTWLPEHEDARKAYWELVKLPLHAFANLFIEWSMRQDFSSEWRAADQALSESIDREMPERIRDGLCVVSFGLRQFEHFGQAYELSIPEQLDIASIFNGILDQLVSAEGRTRVGLDVLLDHLTSMAEMGRLVDGKHYHVDLGEDRLALRLDSCLAEYRRYAKDTASDDEVLSKESYLRQLRENFESKGYVLAVSARVYYSPSAADRLRSVVISISKAEASGIDLGGFTRNHQ